MNHIPVLLKEVLECLNPGPGQNFIDCTIGFAGHAIPILERVAPIGKVLGIELDKEIFKKLKSQDNIILVQGNYADLKQIVKENNFYPINGILFDLGMSSWQIEEKGRGFSFQKDEPLDMRVNNGQLTAEEIINQWPEKELVRVFQEYGEERYAGRIAKIICQIRQTRPIKTTKQLVDLIIKIVPRKKINPATRIFQALRITVNDELNNLKKALPQALEILEKNGRLAIISFHSLEDRIIKNFFKQEAKEVNLKILTKKPLRPTDKEINLNPRSRSAKLRVAVKL
jgi:16S rRNA (cytosine1402-N4)-methyltransferase